MQVKTNVGANLMFALRTITRNEPMTETHTFVSKHRFDSGYCLEGEHKVPPLHSFSEIGLISVIEYIQE